METLKIVAVFGIGPTEFVLVSPVGIVLLVVLGVIVAATVKLLNK